MKQQIAGALLFVSLPAAAFLCGRSFAHEERPALTQQAIVYENDPPAPPPISFRAEKASRISFADLYRSLQHGSHAQRADKVHELRAIGSSRRRGAAILSLFKCLAMVDADEAVGFVQDLDNDEDKIRAVEAVIKGAPGPTTPAMVRMLMNLTGTVGETCREKFLNDQLSYWSAIDPVAAVNFLDENPSYLHELGQMSVLSNWAAVDPAAALAWLERHQELATGQEVLEEFVHGVFENNPETARQYVSSNAADERFQRLFAAVAGSTFMQSKEDAERFIQALPEGEARRRALFGVAELNMALLAEKTGDGPRVFTDVADWMLQFSANDRGGSVGRFLDKWQKLDPVAPLAWMGNLGAEKQQEVINEYAEFMGTEDLSRMMAARDERLRGRILSAFVAKQGATPAEREAVIAQMGLGAEEAAMLTDIARKSP